MKVSSGLLIAFATTAMLYGPCMGKEQAAYKHYPSLNCHAGFGAGSWQLEYPVGTGVEQCQAYCNALPYGNGDENCALIVVRDNGQCYVKSGPVNIAQCQDQGATKDTYVRPTTSTEAKAVDTPCDETMVGAGGAGYRGCQDKTRDGKPCQKWSSQSPHSHTRTPENKPHDGIGDHNYCRNPDNEPSIWCYTTTGTRWDYCDPKPEFTTTTTTRDPQAGCDETMKGAGGSGYRGCQDTTMSGKPCQKWSSQTPHTHSRTPENTPDKGLGDHNFCRNPDSEPSIWCYTATSTRWEYCFPKDANITRTETAWTTQPTLNTTCSAGVCGKGSWSAFYGSKTAPQCKAICDGFRRLIPEADGIFETVYQFRQNGQFHNVEGSPTGRTPEHSRNVTQVNYGGTGRHWSGWPFRDHFYAVWTGKIEIKAEGSYKFWTRSDDGSKLLINGQQVVSNPGWHGMRWRDGTVTLSVGQHPFVAEMFEGGGGAGMQMYYQGPDTNNRRVIMSGNAFAGGKVLEEGFSFRQNGRFHNVKEPIPAKTPKFERQVGNINYRSTGGYWDSKFQGQGLRDHFYVRWTGFITITTPGTYKFWTRSDDGSRLFIDGSQMVNNPGWHGMRWRDGRRHLDAGKHGFWAEMFEGGGGAGMEMYYQGPDTGNRRIIVPENVLTGSLAGSGKLILDPESPLSGLCTAYSHKGSDCIIYTSCGAVETEPATGICEEPSFDWVGTLADFTTCKYPDNNSPPSLVQVF